MAELGRCCRGDLAIRSQTSVDTLQSYNECVDWGCWLIVVFVSPLSLLLLLIRGLFLRCTATWNHCESARRLAIIKTIVILNLQFYFINKDKNTGVLLLEWDSQHIASGIRRRV